MRDLFVPIGESVLMAAVSSKAELPKKASANSDMVNADALVMDTDNSVAAAAATSVIATAAWNVRYVAHPASEMDVIPESTRTHLDMCSRA